MLFNSLQFLIFLPIVVMIYYIFPKKIRYIWLLVTSYYYDNLILAYGGDYRVKLQVNSTYDIVNKDSVVNQLVKQYGDSLELEYVDNLSANEQPYEAIILIYNAKTDAEVMVTGIKM